MQMRSLARSTREPCSHTLITSTEIINTDTRLATALSFHLSTQLLHPATGHSPSATNWFGHRGWKTRTFAPSENPNLCTADGNGTGTHSLADQGSNRYARPT